MGKNNSKRKQVTETQKWTSVMAKLDNQLKAEEARRKEFKSAKKNK